MVESIRFVRVMPDMANKVCNKKDPLVERRVYMRSESDPKISTGILENEDCRATRGRGPRKRRRSARAAGRGPHVIKNGPLMRQKMSACEVKAERMVGARSASICMDHNIKGPLGVIMNAESHEFDPSAYTMNRLGPQHVMVEKST